MDSSKDNVLWAPTATAAPEIKDTSEQASRRIHILGIGNIGVLIAHSLRGIPNPPPITLLMHRVERVEQWATGKQELKLTTDGVTESRGGYDWEYAIPFWRRHGEIVPISQAQRLDDLLLGEQGQAQPRHEAMRDVAEAESAEAFPLNATSPIRNVIVTVKAQHTVAALLTIKDRLSSDSTILFMQNGMGIIDEVNKSVFPDPETRPEYMLGINSHGVLGHVPFESTHAGFGTISLGLAPRPSRPATPSPNSEEDSAPSTYEMAPSSRYLLRTLTSVPVLTAVAFSPAELFKSQLEKLAINAVLNPLTALLDCRNGALLYNFAMTRCMRLLLSEISSVFTKLPELQGLPNVNTRFSPEHLETLCVGVARKTAANINSMLADVRAGRQTEIKYINGYVVRRGEEVGVTPGFNYMITQLVNGKQQMIMREEGEHAPFVREK